MLVRGRRFLIATVATLAFALSFTARALTLYGISISSSSLVSIDAQTAATTPIGPLGVSSMEGLAYDSVTDRLLGVSYDNNLYTINRITGAATLVGPLGLTVQFPGLEFSADAHTLYLSTSPYYAPGEYTSSLYRVNPATGASTRIGDISGNTIVDGLAYDPTAHVLYGVSSATYKIYIVNTANATLTEIGDVGTSLIFTEAAFNAGLLYWTDAGRSSLYVRDMATGVNHLIGGDPDLYEVRGLAFAPIPEPSVWALLFAGLVLLFQGRAPFFGVRRRNT